MPLLDLFWTMLIFSMWFVWIWLLISVFADIFRSDDLSGWGKAGWVILTVILPYLGVLVYLGVRGHMIQGGTLHRDQHREEAMATYPRGTTREPSRTEELVRLAQLRDRGALTEHEFAAQKERILNASDTPSTDVVRPGSRPYPRGAGGDAHGRPGSIARARGVEPT